MGEPAVCVERRTCRLCGSGSLERALELTPTPLANNFLARPGEQPCYPLDMMLCGNCSHAQLGVVVDPEALFREYLYASATFEEPPDWHPVVRSFRAYAGEMVERFGPHSVLDIGSNDGTLMREFRRFGCRVMGVDPARTVAPKGLEVVTEFLTPDVARQIVSDHGHFDLVTANNVFAHIDDLGGAVDAARELLAPKGVLVVQVSYLYDVVRNGYFDTIYHEHLDYHTVGPLVDFFSRHGLQVFDVQHVGLYGGSIRLFVSKPGGEVLATVGEAISFEKVQGLESLATYDSLRRRIEWSRSALLSRLPEQVIGFGAPAKLTTLMYHWGLGAERVPLVVDDTPMKQGRYTPGTNIPIRDTSSLMDGEPVLVFAWNCADAIRERHGERPYFVPRFGL